MWLGNWDDRQVAVKVLKASILEMDSSSMDEFQREVQMMKTMRHRFV